MAITKVQLGSGSSGAGNSTITWSGTVTAGNWIAIGVVTENNSTVTISSITSSLGNTYTQTPGSPIRYTAGYSRNTYLAYGKAATGGSETITINLSSNPGGAVYIEEFSVTAGNSVSLDVESGTPSTGTSVPDPGAGTLSGSGNYLIFEVSNVSGSDTTGTGYTRVANVSGNECQYKILSSASSWGASSFATSNASWAASGMALKEVSAGATYTLTAAQGSFSETGEAAAFKAARVLTASQGSFAETGEATALKASRKLTASQGSFSETGEAAAFLIARKLVLAQGSFALTGQALQFLAARILAANQGTYALTGEAATLLRSGSFALTANYGSFVLTGEDAVLTYSAVSLPIFAPGIVPIRVAADPTKAGVVPVCYATAGAGVVPVRTTTQDVAGVVPVVKLASFVAGVVPVVES